MKQISYRQSILTHGQILAVNVDNIGQVDVISGWVCWLRDNATSRLENATDATTVILHQHLTHQRIDFCGD